MRRCLLRVLTMAAMLSMSPIVTRADSITTISLAALFTCQTNCTPLDVGESLAARLKWDATTGTAIPGTISVTASGDLGSFNYLKSLTNNSGTARFWFENTAADEIVLSTLPPWNWRAPEIGRDGTQATILCGSPQDACMTEGFAGFYPLKGTIIVTPVPEPTTMIYFPVLSGLVIMGKRLTGWWVNKLTMPSCGLNLADRAAEPVLGDAVLALSARLFTSQQLGSMSTLAVGR
jgi:hypothetical protein